LRIVGIGTKSNLWKPTAKQLALPDWDQSYLEWADLSGFKVPQMRDADLRNYKATGTVFGNTDWTIMRDPIDLTGAIFNPSSYNHDLVVEAVRQNLSSLSGKALLMAQVIIVRVSSDYGSSWQDTLNAVVEAGLSKDDLQEGAKVFAGRPSLLSRLEYHLSADLITSVKLGDGISVETPIRVKLPHGDVSERFDFFLTGTDRYIAARAIEQAYGEVVAHVGQLDPWPYVIVASPVRVVADFGWWRTSWPS